MEECLPYKQMVGSSILPPPTNEDEMKTKEKLFKVSVIVKGKKAPDWGLGKGVLTQLEISFADLKGWGWKHPSFLMKKMAVEDKLIKDTIKIVWKEMKSR